MEKKRGSGGSGDGGNGNTNGAAAVGGALFTTSKSGRKASLAQRPSISSVRNYIHYKERRMFLKYIHNCTK